MVGTHEPAAYLSGINSRGVMVIGFVIAGVAALWPA